MPLAVHPERQDFQMLPLMGAIDFDQVFQALVEIGFDGVCNLTVNLPKANYTTFASTGRPKMSLSMTNRVYAWTFRVVQRMLQSYNLFQA
jgi:sugar phosphate isomerase/epimerase